VFIRSAAKFFPRARHGSSPNLLFSYSYVFIFYSWLITRKPFFIRQTSFTAPTFLSLSFARSHDPAARHFFPLPFYLFHFLFKERRLESIVCAILPTRPIPWIVPLSQLLAVPFSDSFFSGAGYSFFFLLVQNINLLLPLFAAGAREAPPRRSCLTSPYP